MRKNLVCPECLNEEDFLKKEDNIIHEVRGENYNIPVEKFICPDCGGEIIEDDDFDESLLEAFNEYRQKHNMLLPEEIKEIRKKYGLSQRGLSRLMNWGEVTVPRYENGNLQDDAHDQLLKLLKKPQNMLDILEEKR